MDTFYSKYFYLQLWNDLVWISKLAELFDVVHRKLWVVTYFFGVNCLKNMHSHVLNLFPYVGQLVRASLLGEDLTEREVDHECYQSHQIVLT